MVSFYWEVKTGPPLVSVLGARGVFFSSSSVHVRWTWTLRHQWGQPAQPSSNLKSLSLQQGFYVGGLFSFFIVLKSFAVIVPQHEYLQSWLALEREPEKYADQNLGWPLMVDR